MSEYESIKRYVEIKERDCETMPIRPSQALLNQRHLIDIIEKYRKGLEFYGDGENYGAYYDDEDIFCIAPIEEDEGKSARELLELTEE